MAARPAETIRYSVGVGRGVTDVTPRDFASEVSRVLSDPRGWRKYGYDFVQVPAGAAPSAGADPPVLHIHLETAGAAASMCGRPGFSCWRGTPHGDIVINLDNWLGGSRSRLPPDRYHSYVICHEVGHALGLEHQACPIEECERRGLRRCPASVMQQMTRGPAAVSPCVESEWPLDPDWGVDTPPGVQRRAVPRRMRGLHAGVVAILVLVLAAAALLGTGCRGAAGRWPSGAGGARRAALGGAR